MFTQADIDAAIQRALEPIMAEFQALKNNRDQILAEKRKAEGRVVGKTEDGIIRTEKAIMLPRDIARDRPRYLEMKAEADKHGLELLVLSDKAELETKPLPDTFTGSRIHYVRNDLARDPRFYQQEKRFAESKGLNMHLFKTAEELPAEYAAEKA